MQELLVAKKRAAKGKGAKQNGLQRLTGLLVTHALSTPWAMGAMRGSCQIWLMHATLFFSQQDSLLNTEACHQASLCHPQKTESIHKTKRPHKHYREVRVRSYKVYATTVPHLLSPKAACLTTLAGSVLADAETYSFWLREQDQGFLTLSYVAVMSSDSICQVNTSQMENGNTMQHLLWLNTMVLRNCT